MKTSLKALSEFLEQAFYRWDLKIVKVAIYRWYGFDPERQIHFFLEKLTGIRVGYGLLFVVIGTTITVFNPCISSGEMTTQGRVFFISLPSTL